MKKKNWIWISAIIITVFAIFIVLRVLLGIGKSKTDVSEFGPYISGYTSGVISKSSSIKIQLTADFAKKLGPPEERKTDIFRFSPGIEGTAGWTDYRTIQFTPDDNLQSDKTYTVSFRLVELDTDIERKFRVFEYDIKTKPQNFSLEVTEIKTIDKKQLKWQQVRGIIRTADTEKTENIEKLIDAKYEDKSLKTTCMQTGHNQFEFLVDSVPRKEEAGTLNIHYNGKALGLDKKGELQVSIPSLSDFLLMSVDIVQSPQQYIKLQFSDPIMKNQLLDGLITLQDDAMINFSVQDNIIKVYPSERIDGERKFIVNQGIKNILGHRFKDTYLEMLDFVEISPDVRLIGEGVIMPKAEGQLVFPFEAVNLRAVDVRISKIFENNILQYLQVNDIDDNYQLNRVSKVIKKKTVQLDQTDVTDLGKWNRYTLDLNELINSDPGGIYRVDISFRKKHSIYPCNDDERVMKDRMTSTTGDDEEFWNNYENHYYNSDWSNWEHRDDPCHDAYYGFRRAVSKNIYASNMGLIGKKGNDGSMMIVVTSLMDATPLENVQVDLYNYQQQLISGKKTNKKGIAEFTPDTNDKEVFFAVATNEDDKAYLKMKDGNSLSISDFDVGGTDVSDGMKAFTYTERGVHRPGDSIYIGFILEDIHDQLPEGHPVAFELYNPKSQRIDKQIQNLDENRFHVFRTATGDNAITGNYSARITVGGKTFYHSLPVETIKPNRLKIELNLQDDALYHAKANPANIWINWLHGAPGKNLKVRVSLSLYNSVTRFDDFEAYHFDDITSSFDFNTTEILEATTDNEGHIQEDIVPEKLDHAPGKLMAKLTIKAFEKGGNFSIKEEQFPYHPFTSYVGMKLPESSRGYGNYLSTGKDHSVDIVTVDTEGQLNNKSTDIRIELLKSDWNWWYYSYNNNTNYKNSEHIDLIKKDVITTQDGKTSWDFKVNRDNWGYYILKITDLKSGHATSQRIYADRPAYASVGRNQAKSANILQFNAEKDEYQVDETVKITLPGSENGRAFITIENGSRVLDHYWLETDETESEFTFIATEEMSPNVYIHVSLLQPHEQTSNDRPVRMYGVIPVNIEDKETHLHPELIMPDKLRAESDVEIKVKEKNKKDMSYTIAIVDEGLLSLTNFKTPDPWSYFYAREALGVKTWDIYDWVIGAYGSKIERLLSVGGGAAADKESARKANRFEPVVRFIGPFHLKGGRTNTHEIKLPRYVGAVRTMLVAGNTEGAYGNAEKTTPVTKPLMVLGDMPRVLGPGESLQLPVNVFAMEDNVKNVNIKIKTNDLLIPEAASSQNIKFSKPGEQTINFPLKVAEKTGLAKVDIIASSASEKSTYSIEIDVRYPNPKMRKVDGISIGANETKTMKFDQFGIPESASTSLEVYAIPPINLHKRLKYLMNYPHGCSEQVISAAFPQLYLEKFTKLTPQQQREHRNNIKTAISKLRKYQMSNGGFSYWPGGNNTNLWTTNYAGHFLLEAKKMGYEVPDIMLSNWGKYQKEKAVKWTNDGKTSQLIQAYRLYTLALSGNPRRSAMNRLRQTGNLYEKAGWRLAAAYEMTGKHRVASNLISGLETKVNPYFYGATFGSSVRDEAMILETLVLMDEKEKAFDVLRTVATSLGDDSWMSTQTTAYALIATASYIDTYSVSDKVNVSYQLNQNDKTRIESDNPMAQMDLHDVKQKDNHFEVTNNTGGTLFVRLIHEGVPEAGSETASHNKINMKVKYMYPDGTTINPAKIEQGTDFVCEVKLTHDSFESTFKELALSQIFPPGWEIINSRLFSTEMGETSPFSYQDIRDDRVYTYFDLYKGKTKTYRVMLNASYTGKFYLPACNVEAMYDNSIHARNKGQWVEIVRP
ncbi:MAG: alpha-2-macroglobulin family protein [Bacteroidota bacterium]